MSHNINRTNGVDSVFVVGEPAWHELGQVVQEAQTSEEAIKLANLDYEVEKRKLWIDAKPNRLVEVKQKFATVRTDTEVPLGVVGGRYTVLQNSKAFQFFDEIVGSKEAIYHTAGALGDGEKIWILAKLPKNLLIKREDVVEQYILLVNSHDGTSMVSVRYTPVRVVCQNTLSMALNNSSSAVSVRHTANMMTKVSQARQILGLSLDYSKAFEETANLLAEKVLTVAEVESYFDGVLGIKEDDESTRKDNQKNELLQLFEKGAGNNTTGIRHTLWAAFNAVTQYVDYDRTVKGEKSDPTRRLDSIWFGSGADLKASAFERAKQLVTI